MQNQHQYTTPLLHVALLLPTLFTSSALASEAAVLQFTYQPAKSTSSKKFYPHALKLQQLEDKSGEYFAGMQASGLEVAEAPALAPEENILRNPILPIKVKETVLMIAIPGQDGRSRITTTTEYPYRCFVHLDLFFPHGSGGGTGTMIGQHHLLTAAHCVYDSDTKRWADNVVAYCGLNDDIKPFKPVKAIHMYVPSTYIEKGDKNFDFALVVLEEPIGLKTGWLGYLYTNSDTLLKDSKITVTGYPADKGLKQMWTMTHTAKKVEADRVSYDLDTYGGQSGSAIYIPYKISENTVPIIVGCHTKPWRLVKRKFGYAINPAKSKGTFQIRKRKLVDCRRGISWTKGNFRDGKW